MTGTRAARLVLPVWTASRWHTCSPSCTCRSGLMSWAWRVTIFIMIPVRRGASWVWRRRFRRAGLLQDAYDWFKGSQQVSQRGGRSAAGRRG